MRSILLVYCYCLSAEIAGGAEITVLSWNVESDRPEPGGHFADGNTPATIAAELTALQADRGPYDLIALTEVLADSRPLYEVAANVSGREYRAFASTTGETDRMLLMFDAGRFERVGGPFNLEEHEGIEFPGGSARQPFFIHLRDTRNDSLEFIFMVNHLNRGNANHRRLQAAGLREWAEDQTLPIIAAGDYNFDFAFEDLTGNRAMAIFMENDSNRETIWKWIVPDAIVQTTGTGADERTMVVANFVDTNWADDHEFTEHRVDRYPNSMLDFVFVAQGARHWRARSAVIVRDGDFPDTADTSDHRPVEAGFDP